MRRFAALTTAALAMAGIASSASAKQQTSSFAGSCWLEGTTSFSPPATNSQQSLYVTYDASGICTGSLNVRAISNAPVRLHQAVREVDGSCLHADTTQPGLGVLRFADGTKITYTFEFHFPSVVGTFTFRGRHGGSATGLGNLLTPRTPPDVADRCAGEGVRETPLDVSLTTDTPLVGRKG